MCICITLVVKAWVGVGELEGANEGKPGAYVRPLTIKIFLKKEKEKIIL